MIGSSSGEQFDSIEQAFMAPAMASNAPEKPTDSKKQDTLKGGSGGNLENQDMHIDYSKDVPLAASALHKDGEFYGIAIDKDAPKPPDATYHEGVFKHEKSEFDHMKNLMKSGMNPVEAYHEAHDKIATPIETAFIRGYAASQGKDPDKYMDEYKQYWRDVASFAGKKENPDRHEDAHTTTFGLDEAELGRTMTHKEPLKKIESPQWMQDLANQPSWLEKAEAFRKSTQGKKLGDLTEEEKQQAFDLVSGFAFKEDENFGTMPPRSGFQNPFKGDLGPPENPVWLQEGYIIPDEHLTPGQRAIREARRNAQRNDPSNFPSSQEYDQRLRDFVHQRQQERVNRIPEMSPQTRAALEAIQEALSSDFRSPRGWEAAEPGPEQHRIRTPTANERVIDSMAITESRNIMHGATRTDPASLARTLINTGRVTGMANEELTRSLQEAVERRLQSQGYVEPVKLPKPKSIRLLDKNLFAGTDHKGFDIQDEEGRFRGTVSASLRRKSSGDTIYIHGVANEHGVYNTKFGNTFGNKNTRSLLRQLQEHFPTAVRLDGVRVSGARKGKARDWSRESPPVQARIQPLRRRREQQDLEE